MTNLFPIDLNPRGLKAKGSPVYQEINQQYTQNSLFGNVKSNVYIKIMIFSCTLSFKIIIIQWSIIVIAYEFTFSFSNKHTVYY